MSGGTSFRAEAKEQRHFKSGLCIGIGQNISLALSLSLGFKPSSQRKH